MSRRSIALTPVRFLAASSTQFAPQHEHTHGKAWSRVATLLAVYIAEVQRYLEPRKAPVCTRMGQTEALNLSIAAFGG